MKVFLIIIAAIFAIFGAGVFLVAKSAIHEILSILAVGFAALMLGSVGIIAAVERAADKIAARIVGLK